MITIKSNYIIRFCITLLILVVLGHTIGVILTSITIHPASLFFHQLFYFSYEKNIPALFSATLFILLSYYFKSIGTQLTSTKRYWDIISYIAVFLACDEWLAIHEATLNIYGLGPFNIPIWVWIYGSLGLLLLIYLRNFLSTIPADLMKKLLVSGFIFVSGSAIMEIITYTNGLLNFPPIGAHLHLTASPLHQIGWFLEDALEMSGVLTMIIAAHLWLLRNNVTHLNIKKWPAILMITIGLGDMSYYLITSPLNIK